MLQIDDTQTCCHCCANFQVTAQPAEVAVFDPDASAAVIRRAIEKMQEALGDEDPDELPMMVDLNLNALVACALQARKPRLREYQHIIYTPCNVFALVTDIGYGPAYHGPYPTQAERDEFTRQQVANGKLDFTEDVIFYLDFVDGKLEHIWMPEAKNA